MGRVAVTFKLMPDGADTDLNSIKDSVKKIIAKHKDVQLKDVNEKPIAFGLKALEILLVLPDTSISELEDALTKIEGVASIEAGSATLI